MKVLKRWADWFLKVGIVVISLAVLLWLLSIPFQGFQVWITNTFWGILFRIIISVAGIGLVYLGIRHREHYVHTVPEEGLEVQISPDVYKTLITRVLENYEGVALEDFSFRPAKVANNPLLYVWIKTKDPFSISEVIQDLKEQMKMTLTQSLGSAMELQVVIRVKTFEVYL